MEEKEKGQALLIVLLVMSVVLTIGLSVVSRSVTDVRISTQSEESARAFWVAQGELEKALKAQPGEIQTGLSGDISYEVKKTVLTGGNFFAFSAIKKDVFAPFWLMKHGGSGNLDESVYYLGSSINLYFGNEGESDSSATTPALEAILIYKSSSGKYYSRRVPFDPNSGRRGSNKFSTAAAAGYNKGGRKYAFKATFTLPSGQIPILLSLRLIYNTTSQILGVETVSSDFTFPNQGDCYESTATVTASNITKKLKECRHYKITPNIFSYLFFSGVSI